MPQTNITSVEDLERSGLQQGDRVFVRVAGPGQETDDLFFDHVVYVHYGNRAQAQSVVFTDCKGVCICVPWADLIHFRRAD